MADFEQWLRSIGLEKYSDILRSNSVDFEILAELGEDDLSELGFNLGDRKRMLRAIRALQATAPEPAPSGPGEPEGSTLAMDGGTAEMRQLTLMFVDLVGSTQLANELDLETYRDVLHQYQDACLKVIRERHGHDAQFQGDGIVAYYGYPSAEEDDAERAVLSGLEICQAIAELPAVVGRPLEVRIGIATGDVVVDSIEGHASVALGETPNLAARIQSVSEPGTVAISDRTRQLLGANFECEWLGRPELKGFREGIDIWAVRGAGGTELRFQARQRGKVMPIIDREDELRLLESRWQAARKGNCQVVMLSGEAGIGKSRLARALIENVAGDDSVLLNFQCLPNHDASAFHPVIAFINHVANIARSDSAERKIEKLGELLSAWAYDAERLLPLFARLLSIPPPSDADQPEITPENMKAQLQNALIGIIGRLADRKPVLLLFEDLHWIDPSSEDLLDLMIERLAGARVLILCTHRPDYRPRWTGLARVTSLSISRLDARYSREFLRNMLPEGTTPEEIEAQIIEKTDGVPLFLEEMARMVGQRYADDPAARTREDLLSLPSTLKDLLRSKIDNLAAPRDFVSLCAAIGRTILPSMVLAVTAMPGNRVQGLFEKLTEAQILVPRRDGQETTYFFRHALIQDAAYELMLPSRARALHRSIAEAIRSSFPDLAAEHPDQLARHFSRADMPAEALEAWRNAADLAMGRFATEETIYNLREALKQNGKLEDVAERNENEIGLRKTLNVALNTHAFGSEEVRANFLRLNELLRGSGADDRNSFLALVVQYGTQLMLGETQSALELCAGMREIAEASADPLMLAVTAHSSGMANFMAGDFDAAVEHFDRALVLRDAVAPEEIFEIYAADVRIVDIAMRCWAIVFKSEDRATQRPLLAAGLAAAEAEPHDFSRCYALSVLAAAHQVVGDIEAVRRLSAAALEISRQRKFLYWEGWSAILHGWALARGGDPSAGIAEIDAGIETYLATDSVQMILYARTLLADAFLAAGDVDRGLATIEEVRTDPLTGSLRYQTSMTDRVEADLRCAAAGLQGGSPQTGADGQSPA